MGAEIVHLELHTSDLTAARRFYRDLLGWGAEQTTGRWGTYVSLNSGGTLCGGIVECGCSPSVWLPYVEVDGLAAATDHARVLGASVILEPREGPAGWRSVVRTPAGGELALWQPKR